MPSAKAVIVELELTPHWWRRLTNNMGKRQPALPAMLALHTRACEVAFQLGEHVQSLKTSRCSFVARVLIPIDVSLQVVCEQAGAVVDELNALDVSCLGDAIERAKYL